VGYIERWFITNGETIRDKMVELRASPRLADFLSLQHTETLARISKKYNLILRVKGDYAVSDGDFKVVVI
jgi:hypothetical protein